MKAKAGPSLHKTLERTAERQVLLGRVRQEVGAEHFRSQSSRAEERNHEVFWLVSRIQSNSDGSWDRLLHSLGLVGQVMILPANEFAGEDQHVRLVHTRYR